MRVCVILLALFVISGCTNNLKVPGGVIPISRMENIMWDMVKADRFVNGYIMMRRDSANLLNNEEDAAIFYEKVFQLHGITRDEFLDSYKFYLSRPDLTKLIFDSIAAKAERIRPELYAPVVQTDSLVSVRNDSMMRKLKDSFQKK